MSSFTDKCINTIRLLAVDMVAAANLGHPGAPMGLAPAAHIVFGQMKFNPKNPDWLNRDRFVLLNGHACALLYLMLYLTGYDFLLEDIKHFRQLDSKTPGHPEFELPGVEVTTGPLGQGILNAVGLAIAQKAIAARYNKPGFTLSDNYTYCFFGDGCMMEGVASEAMSLAGHLQLDNIIAFYDDNHITIDGDIKVAFTEDVTGRLEAYGWHVIWVKGGDLDYEGIAKAIEEAKKINKPVVIRLTTVIGFGSLQQGTHGVHGAPLKKDDIKQLKDKWGFDDTKTFQVDDDVADFYHGYASAGAKAEEEWNTLFALYQKEFPELGAELARRLSGKLPTDWEKLLPTYTPADKAIALRKLLEIALEHIFDALPELIGGSADLTGSNLTRTSDAVDFQPESTGLGLYAGRYVRYGVREHGMGAIMNGISAYGANFKPYGGTFLNFVLYAAGAVRLSALSGHPVVWVATHDLIGLGEDGPTHQPIETLAHFRALPNMMVWRPADGNETLAAYIRALDSKHTPSIIALSRQNLPQLEGSSVEKALKGGYTLVEADKPQLILISTGSEVGIAVDTAKLLGLEGISVGVVSLPDHHTFDQQSFEYRKLVLPDGVPILSIEVMSTSGWSKYSHAQFGINTFGASGPYLQVYKKFGFDPEQLAAKGKQVIDYYKGKSVLSPLDVPF